MAGATLVIQSHRSPLPALWYETCVGSVRGWAHTRGFDHSWFGDELFALLDAPSRRRTAGRPVIAADLARLLALQLALKDGYDRVVWVDADVLVLRSGPELPSAGAAFGREVWVSEEAGQLRVRRKIHNAFMAFCAGDPVLDFYAFAARRILERHTGPMAPQLIGPKLLTLLHNAIGFEVIEDAAMVSPAVTLDLLAGAGAQPERPVAWKHGAALERFVGASTVVPQAVNLCGSLVGRDGLDDGALASLVELLVETPGLLAAR